MMKNYIKHGYRETLPYHSWNGLRGRCNNPKNSRYHDYGGRGIKVCERWSSFLNFLADMGFPPTQKHSIDRIDTNGNYEPSNCRWATAKEQAANRRKAKKRKIACDTLMLTCRGVTKTIREWLPEAAVAKTTIRSRLAKGWAHEDVLFKPRKF